MVSITNVPIDVALALVTGRRIELPAHEALLDHLIFAYLVDRPLTKADAESPDVFETLLRRAKRAFPRIAHETGRELDGGAHDANRRTEWLAEKAARYGAEIEFFPDRMTVDPL